MKIKGLLIDPINKKVTEVEFEHSLDEIYKLINCDTFAVPFIFSNNDSLFVDDEGLLKDPEHFFMISEYGRPIAGMGLILGTDEEGESVSAKTKEIEVLWMTRNETRLWARSEQESVDKLRKSEMGDFVIATTMNEVLNDDE